MDDSQPNDTPDVQAAGGGAAFAELHERQFASVYQSAGAPEPLPQSRGLPRRLMSSGTPQLFIQQISDSRRIILCAKCPTPDR